MTNPVKNMQRAIADYKQMNAKDQKRYLTDMVLNNALYIIIQYKETAIMQLKEQLESEREKHEKKLEKERAQSRISIEFLKHQIELKDARIDTLLEMLQNKE